MKRPVIYDLKPDEKSAVSVWICFAYFELTVEEKLCAKQLSLTNSCLLLSGLQKGKKCRRVLRSREPEHISFGGCTTLRRYRPKTCGSCADGRCCRPSETRTVRLHFRCPDGESITRNVMWIQRCGCSKSYCSANGDNSPPSVSLHNDIHTFSHWSYAHTRHGHRTIIKRGVWWLKKKHLHNFDLRHIWCLNFAHFFCAGTTTLIQLTNNKNSSCSYFWCPLKLNKIETKPVHCGRVRPIIVPSLWCTSLSDPTIPLGNFRVRSAAQAGLQI